MYPCNSWDKVRKPQLCVVYENWSCKCVEFRERNVFVNSAVFIVTNQTLSIPKVASLFDINIPYLSDSFGGTDSFLSINYLHNDIL